MSTKLQAAEIQRLLDEPQYGESQDVGFESDEFRVSHHVFSTRYMSSIWFYFTYLPPVSGDTKRSEVHVSKNAPASLGDILQVVAQMRTRARSSGVPPQALEKFYLYISQVLTDKLNLTDAHFILEELKNMEEEKVV